eukprot:2542835-Rhodomonas_salina.1
MRYWEALMDCRPKISVKLQNVGWHSAEWCALFTPSKEGQRRCSPVCACDDGSLCESHHV